MNKLRQKPVLVTCAIGGALCLLASGYSYYKRVKILEETASTITAPFIVHAEELKKQVAELERKMQEIQSSPRSEGVKFRQKISVANDMRRVLAELEASNKKLNDVISATAVLARKNTEKYRIATIVFGSFGTLLLLISFVSLSLLRKHKKKMNSNTL